MGRYLFVSSVSAYDLDRYTADHDEFSAPLATMDDPADESDPPYGPDYGPRKPLCEHEVVEAFGDRAVIVRPGQIVGPGSPPIASATGVEPERERAVLAEWGARGA